MIDDEIHGILIDKVEIQGKERRNGTGDVRNREIEIWRRKVDCRTNEPSHKRGRGYSTQK